MVLPGVIGYVLFREKIGDDNDATLMVMMKEFFSGLNTLRDSCRIRETGERQRGDISEVAV